MTTTLANLNTLLNDRRRDTGTGSIDMTTVGFRAINSTLQVWNEIHDWPWTIKTLQFNYNSGITTYPLDNLISDFKYPVTLKYYKPTNKVAEFWLTASTRFDSAILWAKRFAITDIAGVQYLRVQCADGNVASLQTASAYNTNGTWVGASAISNVGTDNYEGYSLPSSVKFDYNGTAGTLTNSTISKLDLSAFQNRSNIYFDIDAPAVTGLASYTLKWGTDASNYWTVTVTVDYVNAAFQTGWDTIKIPWNSPTTVGSPTVTNITYVQLTVTCSPSENLGTFRVQNFRVCENIPLLMTYYSTFMVETALLVQSQVFASSAATTDLPLWSGRWDVATESFINSVLQTIFWITGEYTDMQIAQQKILEIVEPLKRRFPSKRRYPSLQFVTDTNYQSDSNWGSNSWTQ